jgi:antitoxin component YwqK of YwqJK toxin-antitoxin module
LLNCVSILTFFTIISSLSLYYTIFYVLFRFTSWTIDGKIDGDFTLYFHYTKNKKIEGTAKKGLIDGYYVAYYRDGSKMIDRDLKNGLPNGYCCAYDLSGEKLCGNFVNGVGTGDANGVKMNEPFSVKFTNL